MHWRGLSPSKAAKVAKKTRALFEPLAEMEGLSLLEFEAGLELRVGRDKGGAVEAIAGEMRERGATAYLGDDLTDEAAFRAVNDCAGVHLSVLMRRAPRETAADVWLRPPEDLRMFLSMWARAVEALDADGEHEEDAELTAV